MDIGRALTYFTDDKRWVEKTAIGTGVLLISTTLSIFLIGLLGMFIFAGYMVRLLQNVRDGAQPVLPEWDQWGDDFIRGLKLFWVQLVWMLPLILVFVPLFVSIFLAENGSVIMELVVLCIVCLQFLLIIAYAVLQPGFTIAFARNEAISDGLQVSEIWDWTREHIGDVVIVVILYVVGCLIITTVGSVVGLILCLIGSVVTLPLSLVIVSYFQNHLYGQLAQRGGSDGNIGRGEFGEMPDTPPEDGPPQEPEAPQPSGGSDDNIGRGELGEMPDTPPEDGPPQKPQEPEAPQPPGGSDDNIGRGELGEMPDTPSEDEPPQKPQEPEAPQPPGGSDDNIGRGELGEMPDTPSEDEPPQKPQKPEAPQPPPVIS